MGIKFSKGGCPKQAEFIAIVIYKQGKHRPNCRLDLSFEILATFSTSPVLMSVLSAFKSALVTRLPILA